MKKNIPFTKMSGAGNDFVVIDNRRGMVSSAAKLARMLCDRRWGVGADGLLLLEKSRKAAYRMMYYNADGSHGGMCGNGGRCIARYAVALGIAPKDHTFEALGHIYRATTRSKQIRLRMKDPKALRDGLVVRIGGRTWRMSGIDTGAPHAVILLDQSMSLDKVDVVNIGRKIRNHGAFSPRGTNVNFVERVARGRIRMRTYERGVEAETLACGTGSIASAIVASRRWKLRSPVEIQTSAGKILTVSFHAKGGKYSDVELQGPAIVTFEGNIDV